MNCEIHTIHISKKTYFVFVGKKAGEIRKVFVWKKKEEFFYIFENVSIIKAEMFRTGNRIDFYYIDEMGYKVTFEGLDRFEDVKVHESTFNSLLPDLEAAIKYAHTLKLKRQKDWKYCINEVFKN